MTFLLRRPRRAICIRALAWAGLAALCFSIVPAAAQQFTPDAPRPLPAVQNDDSWFGAVNTTSAPQLSVAAGAKWTRLIFPWDQIQPTGPQDFSPSSGYFSEDDIDTERRLGIDVVGITLYTPTWAARDPQYDQRSVPANLNLPINDPRNYWAAYIRQLVGHYRGRINTWIFDNEPDIYTTDPLDFHTFAGTPADYAQVLKVGYLAAKSVDPTIRVATSGFTYFWDKENNRPLYFQRVLDALATDPDAPRNNWYFDIVDVHTYGNPLNSYTVPLVFQRAMQQRGISKPVWMDESNALIKNDPRVGAGDGPFRATMDEQASYVIESMALARAAGVQRYSTYKMQDEFPENDDEYWGLTRNDGTVRPSYVAYQVAVRYMQDARGAMYYWWGANTPPTPAEVNALLSSDTGRYQWPWPAPVNVVVLDRGADRVTVIWNASPDPAQIALPANSLSAQIADKYGHVAPLVAQGGYYQLSLEPSRNNSDPRDPSLYLVGGSPLIIIEDMSQQIAPAPTLTVTPTPTPSPTPIPSPTPVLSPTLLPAVIPSPQIPPVVATPTFVQPF